MSYESPITAIIRDFECRFKKNMVEAVQAYGFHVNREELQKALEYDRDQYRHGCRDEISQIITALMDLRDAFVAKQPRGEWYKSDRAQGVEQGIEMAIQKVREMAERREDG